MSRLMWDASALTKRFVFEAGTPTVNAIFTSQHAQDHLVTYLGYAETSAVLRHRYLQGFLSLQELGQARLALERALFTSPGFDLLSVTDSDILAGMPLTDQHNLNASDAAILAAYLRLEGQPHTEPSILIVSDHRFARAAAREGLAILNPETIRPEAIPSFLGEE